MPSFNAVVKPDLAGEFRLDRYVSEELRLLPRSQIKSRFREAKINGKSVKLSRLVRPGDLLEISWAEREDEALIPEDIPLDIVYEDDRVVVVNKVQGMVVHPGAGNHRGTLANALLQRRLSRQKELPPAENLRTGIVHRLDKDTSGLIIAAWDDEALAFLAGEFKARRVRKTYAAIVAGIPEKKSGVIQTRLCRDNRDRKRFMVSPDRGKQALSLYRVARSWKTHSLLLLRPRTGRTHQLRVHLRHLGFPVSGDPIYGLKDSLFPDSTLMLHSRTLSIRLPGGAEARRFDAPLPERFRRMIAVLVKREKNNY
ncbi:MAG: RluA family pseudouridine synthase [Treponema sp.]|jgi:23S rRNA pseudouridine1911/1915/1917 synthase|nr:RluA family pseudouridine synthase [Treponema sp.]